MSWCFFPYCISGGNLRCLHPRWLWWQYVKLRYYVGITVGEILRMALYIFVVLADDDDGIYSFFLSVVHKRSVLIITWFLKVTKTPATNRCYSPITG